jgi:ornithine cyclodeaminase/alanine dehydrogenase-like protein (mu-crystallin family)
MPIFLNNAEQEQCITPAEAIAALEDGLRLFARGDAVRRPRVDCILPTTRPDEFFNFSSMEGGFRAPGYYALRIKPDIYSYPIVNGIQRTVTYSYQPGLYGGLVFLYSTDNAEFLAFMNDGFVQHLRVAATAALGVKYLARPDARVLGIVGSGGMARSFALTLPVVRPIERIQVWSPTPANLQAYLGEVRPKLPCELVAVDGVQAVARDADILCLCTTAREPILDPELIRPGMHVNHVTHMELSEAAVAKVDTVGLLIRRQPLAVSALVDQDLSLTKAAIAYIGGQAEERAKIPRGTPAPNRYAHARIVDCVDWETGEPYRRERSDEITLLANASYGTLEGEALNSAGIQGIQFAAVAGRIYQKAKQLGLGTSFPREMFLQDIPT